MMNHKELRVIYEDNHIIVVFKPANILSQSDETEDLDIMYYVKEYLKEKYNKPGNVFLGLVHRLDRRVSGLMVFARTSKAASRLSKAMRENDFSKEYLALVLGKTKQEDKLQDYLVKEKVASEFRARISDKNNSEAKLAILEYYLESYVKIGEIDASLLRVNLISGRYNQIRAQLSNVGHPIINDFKYAYRGENYDDELALTSYKLRFPHPTRDEIMEFEAYPDTKLWKSIIE